MHCSRIRSHSQSQDQAQQAFAFESHTIQWHSPLQLGASTHSMLQLVTSVSTLHLRCKIIIHRVCIGHIHAYVSAIEGLTRWSHEVQVQTRLFPECAGAQQDESSSGKMAVIISSMTRLQALLILHVCTSSSRRSILHDMLTQIVSLGNALTNLLLSAWQQVI